MLYIFLQTVRDDPRIAVLIALAFLISLLVGLSFHEFSHAFVGDTLGDPTPRRQGRLTLNPTHHLDPMGSLMLLFAPFGWAKPVVVNPYNLRFGPAVGMALVAAAGPLSNFLLAAALAVPVKMDIFPYRSPSLLGSWGIEHYVGFLLTYVVLINITLGVFNLLPLAPLDGSRVAALLPGGIGDFFRRMEPYGMGILFLLLALPLFTQGQIDIIGAIIDPIRSRLFQLFLSRR